MAKPIGTLGTVDSITIGQRVIVNNLPVTIPSTATLVELVTSAVSGAGVDYGTFRLVNGTAGVSFNTTFNVVAVELFCPEGTQSATIGYANNDVGVNVSTVPTSPVYYGGSALTAVASIGTNGVPYQSTCSFTMPSGKFLFLQRSLTAKAQIKVWGFQS